MIPRKRSPIVEIPVTFDGGNTKPQGLTNDKFYLSLLVFGVWLFLAVVSIFVDITIFRKIIYIIGSFCVALAIIRYLLIREPYFRKKREDLVEKEYQYPYSIFWNIYEVTNSYPTICRYANGLKSVFVVFDKDVIVGREQDAEYYHYEAISEAYLQMHKRGIDCIHIDYMDTVGKDDRVKGLFELANNSENPDLKEVLLRMFDNVEYIMQHSYASYDVYCFFYNGKDELFLDELDVVLDSFLDANYIRYRILDKLEIGELVKSVFNIEEFSVRDASERLFADLGGTHFLTPIWVERETENGVERVTLNKTTAQKQAEQATREAEKKTRRNKKHLKKELLETDLEEVDLTMDTSQNMNYNNGSNNTGFNNNGFNNIGFNNTDFSNNNGVNNNFNFNIDINFEEENQDYNENSDLVENPNLTNLDNEVLETMNDENVIEDLNRETLEDFGNDTNLKSKGKLSDFDEDEDLEVF